MRRTYRDEIVDAMTALGRRDDTVFVGQAVAFPGTAMHATLAGVPPEKRLELPVMEDAQLGMCLGMSLAGLLPVCIYPRINFLLLAVNQLVNHLDKIPQYSSWRPRVIIRTMVASREPLDPGVQHLGDYSEALWRMLGVVVVVHLHLAEDVAPAYARAMQSRGSTLLIERADCY